MANASSQRVWPQLLPELAVHIAKCLSPNDVACTLRLVNKAAAALFSGPEYTTVRLSQPVPHHAFARHWGAPGASRGLPYRQRLRLLCLTAASGNIPNMEVALAAAGCLLKGDVLDAAAAAGQLEMCEWLLQRGCPSERALSAAAKAGNQQACEWLLSKVPLSVPPRADWAAARGGHVGLMEWLMAARPHVFNVPPERHERRWLLVEVAEGCDLATLQRLHHVWVDAWGPEHEDSEDDDEEEDEFSEDADRDADTMEEVICSAVGSPTPDWAAKVEWLEGRGYPQTANVCMCAARCPDAVERLVWLRGRGYPVDDEASCSAAQNGNLAALQYLHAEGLLAPNKALRSAAPSGHASVVAWLVESPGVGAELTAEVFDGAAFWASIELMTWLRQRGCPWGEGTFSRAAAGGNEVALEWLVEQGCPFGKPDEPYGQACLNSDLATLRCLARLSCPWGPVGDAFRCAIEWGNATVPVIRELLAVGCPVDWKAAEAVVESSYRSDKADVLALLAEERARREGRGQVE